MQGLRRDCTGWHLQLCHLNTSFVSGLFAFSIILVSLFFYGNPGWVEDVEMWMILVEGQGLPG